MTHEEGAERYEEHKKLIVALIRDARELCDAAASSAEQGNWRRADFLLEWIREDVDSASEELDKRV